MFLLKIKKNRFGLAVWATVLLMLGLSSPAYALPDLGLGPFGPGTIDGFAPFDTTGSCASSTDLANAGDDCGDSNNQVRAQDIVTHVWSLTANNYTPGQQNLKDVVLEQTLHPSANAAVNFEKIPVACTSLGGGGSTPPSSITNNPDGSVTLICNAGEFMEGQQKSLSINVKVSGESWNGSNYTSSQRLYSFDANGVANANEANTPDVGPIQISTAPAYDLVNANSSTQGFYNRNVGTRDVGNGPEPGFYTYSVIKIATNERTGVESVEQPITFKDTFSAVSGSTNGPSYPLEFYVTQCRDNPSRWGGEVFGKETYYSSYSLGELRHHTIDSGSCSYVRDNPTDPTSGSFTVTIDNADMSGTRYPVRTFGGTDLSSGPYYATAHRVQIWIPFRSIDEADGAPGNSNGSVYLSSTLSGFDPSSPSGTSNFGNGTEPGHDGAPMADGTRSNNRLGPTEYSLYSNGYFSKRNLSRSNDRVTSYAYTGTSWHAGDGTFEPGQNFVGWIYFVNNGTVPFNNMVACDVFDNTTLKLTDRGNTGGTAGTYAYVGTYAPSGFDYRDYVVEYANINLTGDDPLDGDHDGIKDYDTNTGRYNGDWSKQRAARCEDTSASNGWHTDPTLVAGGIDGVNATRAKLSPAAVAAGKTFDPGHQIRFAIPLEVRDKFQGGPNANQSIPVGTVMANFGGIKTDEWATNWTGRNYTPAPQNGSVDGDRITLDRISLSLDSFSQTPAAISGETASTLAGNQIIWQVNTAIQSTASMPSTAQNVQIINVLPPQASYNSSCTASLPDGTPAGLVQLDKDVNGNAAPGYTRLIWNLGSVTANTVLQPRVICTDSDPLALDGTAVINYAEIRADATITALPLRSDKHTITLEQVGNIQVSKNVDITLDDQNDSQEYTLSWANFAAAYVVAPPTMIDVLPYNGDASASGAERAPPSAFSGAMTLTAAPVTTWIDGSTPGSTEAAIGIWYYTNDAPATIHADPNQNTSDWCLQADIGSGNPGCPASFAEVTALKFIANYSLEKDGDPRQGMMSTFSVQAVGNLPGDIYTNRFAMSSDSLPDGQYLRSNSESTYVASYSLGDLIFADINNNGQYEAALDEPVPSGVTVNLYRPDGTLVGSTQTGLQKPGRYLFSKLASGDYYVEIPASEFQPGGKLIGWDSNFTAAGSDDDVNEDSDQDAYKTGDPASDGIRTNVVTLSAVPPQAGQLPQGNEPLGDNPGNLVDETGDDFTNYTLDMALKPAYDFGDAVPSYGTASHVITADAEPHLGFVPPDVETVTPHGPLADGDGNDENTIDSRYLPTWQIGQGCAGLLPAGSQGSRQMSEDSYCLVVNASNPLSNAAQVIGWLDFDNDGVFNEANERSLVQLNTNPADDSSQGNLPANSLNRKIILQWDNVSPPSAATYLRIRISDDPDFKHPGTLSATLPARNGEVEDYYLELTPLLATVSGRVFEDTSADTINDAAEAGIGGLSVVLYDTANNTCVSTRTNANGEYTFDSVPAGNYRVYEAAGESVPVPQSCDPARAKDPAGYLSTTANSSPAFDVSNATISNIDFGDVKPPVFELDNTQTILPNTAALHSHVFTAMSAGKVSFSIAAANANPASVNWGNQLLLDSNCDGQLNSGDIAIPASITVTAGQQVCILAKVISPAEAPGGAMHTLDVQSEFIFGDDATMLNSNIQRQQDITTSLAGTTTEPPASPVVAPVGAPDPVGGEGKLALVKSVWNASRGSAVGDNDGALVLPGETLLYTIAYENIGNGALNELIINDSVPEFTQLVPASMLCADKPVELPLCAANDSLDGSLSWRWAVGDKLLPGSSGSVSYRVVVE